MNSTLANSTAYLINEWDFSVLFIFTISLHVLNFSLSLPLNTYIIVLLFPTRGVMDASDVFSLNLAIADIFFVFLGPFHCLYVINLCFKEVMGFLLAISIASRCLFQCFVCFERYLAVIHPVTFLRFKPLRYRIVCSIAAWTMSLAASIVCAITYPATPYMMVSIIYIFILSVDIFCAVSILKRLKHPGPRDMESDDGEMNAAKKKAFRIIYLNFLIFLIQNIPIMVTFCIETKMSEYTFNMAIVIIMTINLVTGFLQPLTVLHRNGKL